MSALPDYLLPDSASSSVSGALSVGGCDVIDLAEEYGTPLFIYDEQHIRRRCREAVAGFPGGAAYASKAFMCIAMARLACEEGMDLDVSTGGELFVALQAGASPSRLIFHGNNKSSAELAMAIDANVKQVVVDNADELDRIGRLKPSNLNVVVRVNPGVEAYTHEYLSTGVTDSKFGFSLESGEAAAAVDRVRATHGLNFSGLHAHIGSQVFASSSYRRTIAVLAAFVKDCDAPHLSIGGGLGVSYLAGEVAPSIREWADVVRAAAAEQGISIPIAAEPGRCIVASAAITAYRVGAIKEIPNVRTYVAVDGGMSDNPRPVLYGSGYEAFLARNVAAARPKSVRVVGRHCESGDVIVSNAAVADDIEVGDILCTPVTGAYGHTMGSNYNMALRPAVVFVGRGQSQLVVRRERYEDLIRRDIGLQAR